HKSLWRLREAAYGTDEMLGKGDESRSSEISAERWRALISGTSRTRGILRATRAGSSIAWAFARELSQAIPKFAPDNRTPVLLFDSLDRVREPTDFRLVLERDAQALA